MDWVHSFIIVVVAWVSASVLLLAVAHPEAVGAWLASVEAGYLAAKEAAP